MISRVEEYHIKAYVLLNYAVDIKLAVERMTKLLNIYFSEKKLSLFQMQSLDLLNFFLKEMVVKEILTKANLGETFIDDMYNVMKIANELQYPPMPQCFWCGEKIIGTSCIPYHPDSRCAISLIPINVTPGYKCSFCKCVVSKEMDREYYPIFCPYCDIPMKRRCFDKKHKKNIEDISETSKLDESFPSDCSNDCVKEEIHFSDIEENSVDYLVLTDSEEERDDLVKELYSKIKKITLTTSPEEIEPIISSSNAGCGTNQSTSHQNVKSNDDDDEVDNEEDDENDAAEDEYDGHDDDEDYLN
jgi:hypothetical protein